MNIDEFSPEEQATIKDLADRQNLSVLALFKQALRVYQLHIATGRGNEELSRKFPKMLPEHQEVKMDVWGCCTSSDCPIKGQCAQHASAGDFRAEGGVQPMLIRLRREGFYTMGCCTYKNSERYMDSGMIARKFLERTDVGHIVRPNT
jgi:hypothetical protein